MKFVNNGNSLQELYYRNLMLLGWATVPFVLPFSINSFVQGRYEVGVLTIALMIVAVFNSFCIYSRHCEAVPYWFYFVIKFLALLFTIEAVGFKGLFWSYPLMFVVFFVQPRHSARVMSAIAYLILVTLSAKLLEQEIVYRFAFTLFMLIFFCDVLVGILIRLENKLTELAIRDPLTDAYNRRFMNICLENIIEECRRNFGPASLILLDVDHFKQINDELGHVAGDTVIKNLVDLLNQRKRKIDYVFRVGGEEFVVLLKNADLQQAVMVAENLRRTVEETELFQGRKVTISLGVAQYQSGETDDQWLHHADEELYAAKRAGRNCVRSIIDKAKN